MTAPDSSSAAGYYPDPVFADYDRWWDGEQWADTIRKAGDSHAEPLLISDLTEAQILAMSSVPLSDNPDEAEPDVEKSPDELFLTTLASMPYQIEEPNPWLLRLPYIAAALGFVFAALVAWFFAAVNAKTTVVIIAFGITSIPSIIALLRAKSIQQHMINAGM